MSSLVDYRVLTVFIVLFAFLYIGRTYKTNDSSDFHTAKRQVGALRSIASLFTVVGAPHFAIFTSLAFILGWYALAFYCGTIVGFIILKSQAHKIRLYISSDAHTFNDIASEEIGGTSAMLLSVISIMFVIGVVIAQLILGAQLLESFSGMSYEVCVLLIIVTIIGYLLWGGYKALINTDIIQGFVMLIFTAVLSFYIANIAEYESIDEVLIFPQDNQVIFPLVPLLFLGGILAIIGSPEIWQRILTARNDRIAQRSLLISGGIMLFWGFLVITIGVFISIILPTAEPPNAFVEFITGSLPPGVLGLVSVLVISAIMSTADTDIFVASILYKKEIIRTSKKGALAVKNTRILIIVFGVLSGIGALALTDLMDVWGVLLNLVYISAPLALAIILGRGGKTKKSKQMVLIVSYTLSCIAFIYVAIWVKDFFSWWALIVILSSSFPLFIPGERTLNTKIESLKT